MAAGHIFAFLTGQRRVIYDKVHCDRRLGDLLERNGFYVLRITDGVPDVDIRDTGNGYDRTDLGFVDCDLLQTVELIQLTDLHFTNLVRIVVVHDHYFLIDFYGAVINFTDTDTADIFIIVNGADEDLGTGFRISFRSRDVF